MSKFHDEFFNRGSPVHDDLVIKSVSPDGVEKIIESIDLTSLISQRFTSDQDKNWITVCDLSDGSHRGWKANTAPKINTRYPNKPGGEFPDYNAGENFCAYEENCPGKDRCTAANFHRAGWYSNSVGHDKQIQFACALGKREVTYNTEVIVRGGNSFILGYADAVINLKQDVILHGIITDAWTWENMYSETTPVMILLEAKPQITSVGEVIRQIKTYRESLFPYGHNTLVSVITTYSKLSDDKLAYLKNEDVHVVRFDQASE